LRIGRSFGPLQHAAVFNGGKQLAVAGEHGHGVEVLGPGRQPGRDHEAARFRRFEFECRRFPKRLGERSEVGEIGIDALDHVARRVEHNRLL